MKFRTVNLNAKGIEQQLGACYYNTKNQAVEKAKELGWTWQKNICGKWYTWNNEKKGYFA